MNGHKGSFPKGKFVFYVDTLVVLLLVKFICAAIVWSAITARDSKELRVKKCPLNLYLGKICLLRLSGS